MRLLPFVATCGTAIFIPVALLDFEEFGIKYGDIICLDECGVLNSTGTASLESKTLPKCMDLPTLNFKNELLTVSNPNNAKSTLFLIESGCFSFCQAPSISGLFSVLRPIPDTPGTGLFCFYALLDARGKTWVRWVFA